MSSPQHQVLPMHDDDDSSEFGGRVRGAPADSKWTCRHVGLAFAAWAALLLSVFALHLFMAHTSANAGPYTPAQTGFNLAAATQAGSKADAAMLASVPAGLESLGARLEAMQGSLEQIQTQLEKSSKDSAAPAPPADPTCPTCPEAQAGVPAHFQGVPRLGDGCSRVYLDVGTNIGVQIRKLYEPQLFHGSQVEPRFQQYFGPPGQRQDVCSFGWEPNPRHKEYLQEVEKTYNALGWRTRIFTETAVGPANSTLYFKTDSSPHNMEWGGQVVPLDQAPAHETLPVSVMDLDEFVRYHILDRQIPTGPGVKPPTIVMKMDIEGADMPVLRKLLRSGSFCHIRWSYIEHASHDEVRRFNDALRMAECEALVEWMDDESSHTLKPPLPQVPQ